MGRRYPSGRRSQFQHEDEYESYQPFQPYQTYDTYDPYEQYPTRDHFAPRMRSPTRSPARSPPRRHKSERRRRVPSPSYYSDEPTDSSRRHHRSRHDEYPRGRSAGPDRHIRDPSPLLSSRNPKPISRRPRPSHHDRPLRHESEPRGRESRFLDSYEQEVYPRDPPPHNYGPDSRERPSRDQPHWSRPAPRDTPPKPRSRGRKSRHLEYDDNDEYNSTHNRRPRSQTRDRRNRDPPGPSPTRGRPPQTHRGRDAPKRRSSMPASTKSRDPWWQNPLLQAGARTALTAGAQAAIKSRNDPSPWLGPKGAKVATAALGAALVDGFVGKKHPNGVRENIAKQGVDLASGKAASTARRHHR